MYNKAIREEGHAARLFGRTVEHNPYLKYLKSPDCPNPNEAIMWEHASEWRTGWTITTEREVARAKMQWHRLTGTEWGQRAHA